MKKTKKENIVISKIIEKKWNISFENNEFKLGKWGDVDNFCRVNDKLIILMEFEKGQKHPNTNILKIWPFLEENNDLRIVLLHYFFPENKAPKNRKRLCFFLGEKLEKLFETRFRYVQLNEDTINDLKSLKSFINK